MPGLREALRSLVYLPYKNVLRVYAYHASMVALMVGGCFQWVSRGALNMEGESRKKVVIAEAIEDTGELLSLLGKGF